jgi:hypothetical protein
MKSSKANNYMSKTKDNENISPGIDLLETLDNELRTLMRLRMKLLDAGAKPLSANIIPNDLLNYYYSSIPVLKPAVPIEESVSEDYLICLEDGEKVVLLQSYLFRRYNMDPLTYKRRWQLPNDYPMIPKNYQNKRQKIALECGLGKTPGVRRGRKPNASKNIEKQQ